MLEYKDKNDKVVNGIKDLPTVTFCDNRDKQCGIMFYI